MTPAPNFSPWREFFGQLADRLNTGNTRRRACFIFDALRNNLAAVRGCPGCPRSSIRPGIFKRSPDASPADVIPVRGSQAKEKRREVDRAVVVSVKSKKK